MSTETQQEHSFGPGSAGVAAKPNALVTGRVQSLGEPKRTGEGAGDYFMSEIVITPTRSSKAFRSSFMFRPEMLSTQFTLAGVYGSNDPQTGEFKAVRGLDFIPDSQRSKARPMSQGEIFAFIMAKNVWPETYIAKKDNPEKDIREGDLVISQHSTLSSIVGGSVESWLKFKPVYLALNQAIPSDRTSLELGEDFDLGVVFPTPGEIVDAINGLLKSSTQPEQVFELKQSRRDGNLTDYYELARYHGALTANLVTRLRASVAKKASETSASKKLQFLFKA